MSQIEDWLYPPSEQFKQFLEIKEKERREELKKTQPGDNLQCCGKRLQINDECTGVCSICYREFPRIVTHVTPYQFFCNGGRLRKPYDRIKYFRQWMKGILGESRFMSEEQWETIKKEDPQTPQEVQQVIKKLKLTGFKETSFILSTVTGKKVPSVSPEDIYLVEDMFCKDDGPVPYYPNRIYELFYKIRPTHPLLPWIPRRIKTSASSIRRIGDR